MAKNKAKKSGGAKAFSQKKKSENVPKSTNPFEVHTNLEKISIIGLKLKHDKGMPGVSRGKAIQRRKDTIGREYLQKHKVNKFKDERVAKFGMSKEDTASARFIAEKLNQYKSKKQSRFNLNENEELLTHKGETLEELEQFHDTISDADDDEVGRLDAAFTGVAHFGGDDAEGDSMKRKSAIEDLIADQKRRKAEITMEKESVFQMTNKLDENWKDLLGLMNLKKDQNEDKPKPDDFDRVLREMVFDRRGTVTDKLGTEEKLVKKEKARLERLERERQERMQGITAEDKKAKHRSADDLDDGYFLQSEEQEQAALAYDQEGSANRNDDDSESDADKFSDLVYESGSDTEANQSKKETSQKTSTKTSPKKLTAKPFTEEDRKAMMEKAEKELPYTFELCDQYDELESLLKKHNADYQAVILDRMIKCNHPKVDPANRPKMVTLFTYLMQYVNDIASDTENVGKCFEILDSITPLIYDLSHLNPAETTKCLVEVIKEKQSEYRNSKQFLKLDTLVFLKLVSSLYSTSD